MAIFSGKHFRNTVKHIIIINFNSSRNTLEITPGFRLKAGSLLYSFNNFLLRLYDAICRIDATQGCKRINRGILSNHRTGIEDTATADIRMIAKNGAYFPKAGFILLFAVNYDILTIGFQVGTERATAHMREIAKN